MYSQTKTYQKNNANRRGCQQLDQNQWYQHKSDVAQIILVSGIMIVRKLLQNEYHISSNKYRISNKHRTIETQIKVSAAL